MRKKWYFILFLILVCMFLFSCSADFQEQDSPFNVKEHYAKAEYMIPMRDGIKLFTIVYTPRDISKKYPILLYRTPYSIRPDVLVYQTDVLEEDITVAGPIIASLQVSTTGTDSDWIVKLIDVYPGNSSDSDYCDVKMGHFQMLLAGEIFRAKFRNSFTVPEPMVPDKITKIEFDLRDRYHTFRKGHRIMVQVHSTWFPVYNRNPQKFVDIYHARPSDFQKATQKVYRSAEYPSHLILGVLKR